MRIFVAAMFVKLRNWFRAFRLSLRMKMTLSLSAIAVVLLMSSVISFVEYLHMSNYVSGLISEDIHHIQVTQRLTDAVDTYNLQILAVIGDENLNSLPEFDRTAFVSYCDSLKEAFGGGRAIPMADSVVYAYSAYMLASLELEDVLESNFINTRDWYFSRLQPLFGRLRGYLQGLSETMYAELKQHSEEFDKGFYRSIIPSAVAVSMGIVLVFLLLFYLLAYFVKPIYGMLDAMKAYLSYRHRYTYTFDQGDQLGDLNSQITELTEENRQLRKRLNQ